MEFQVIACGRLYRKPGDSVWNGTRADVIPSCAAVRVATGDPKHLLPLTDAHCRIHRLGHCRQVLAHPLPVRRAGWVPVAGIGSLSVLLRVTKYMEPQYAEGTYPADDPGPT